MDRETFEALADDRNFKKYLFMLAWDVLCVAIRGNND